MRYNWYANEVFLSIIKCHKSSKLNKIFAFNLYPSYFLVSYKTRLFVCLFGWLVVFYGISTFVGYLISNPFSYKWTVLFQTIQFRISTQFNCQKHFYFKLFSLVKQYSFCLQSSVKAVLFQTIQFNENSVSTWKQFYFKLSNLA